MDRKFWNGIQPVLMRRLLIATVLMLAFFDQAIHADANWCMDGRAELHVHHGDVEAVKDLLSMLVPGPRYQVNELEQTIIVIGEPGAIDQVRELLPELDREAKSILFDFQMVEITPNGLDSWGPGSAAPPGIPPLTEMRREYINGVETSAQAVESGLKYSAGGGCSRPHRFRYSPSGE